MTSYQAIRIAIRDIQTMHGSVVGDPEEDHSTNPDRCECFRGQTIRMLREELKRRRIQNRISKVHERNEA